MGKTGCKVSLLVHHHQHHGQHNVVAALLVVASHHHHHDHWHHVVLVVPSILILVHHHHHNHHRGHVHSLLWLRRHRSHEHRLARIRVGDTAVVGLLVGRGRIGSVGRVVTVPRSVSSGLFGICFHGNERKHTKRNHGENIGLHLPGKILGSE